MLLYTMNRVVEVSKEPKSFVATCSNEYLTFVENHAKWAPAPFVWIVFDLSGSAGWRETVQTKKRLTNFVSLCVSDQVDELAMQLALQCAELVVDATAQSEKSERSKWIQALSKAWDWTVHGDSSWNNVVEVLAREQVALVLQVVLVADRLENFIDDGNGNGAAAAVLQEMNSEQLTLSMKYQQKKWRGAQRRDSRMRKTVLLDHVQLPDGGKVSTTEFLCIVEIQLYYLFMHGDLAAMLLIIIDHPWVYMTSIYCRKWSSNSRACL